MPDDDAALQRGLAMLAEETAEDVADILSEKTVDASAFLALLAGDAAPDMG